MQTRFVIFASARTGSTMLVTTLQSLRNVLCLMAIFGENAWADISHPVRQLRPSIDPKWDDLEQRKRQPLAVLDDLAAALDPSMEAFGCKHHFASDAGVTATMIAAPHLRKIVLRRDNELAAFASQLKARQTRLGGSGPVLFEPRPFAMFCRRRAEASDPWTLPLRDAGALEVTYSEVRRDVSRVLTFIGQPPDAEHVALVPKRGSDDILSRFCNPDAAADYLKTIGREDWATEA